MTMTIIPVRVKCLGEHHSIFLTQKGSKSSLCLANHQKKSKHPLSQIKALQVISPEWRCRCWEVLAAWRVYTSWKSFEMSHLMFPQEGVFLLPEAIALQLPLRDVCSKKERRNMRASPSNVLALIPSDLRPYAKEARKRRDGRYSDGLVTPSYFRSVSPLIEHRSRWERGHKRFNPNRNETPESRSSIYLAATPRTTEIWEEKNEGATSAHLFARREATDSWFRKRLQNCNLGTKHGGYTVSPAYSNKFMRGGMSPWGSSQEGRSKDLYWMHCWNRYRWVRELIEYGLAPAMIPPKEMWLTTWDNRESTPSHPAYVLACKFKGSGKFTESTYYFVRILRVGKSEKTLRPNKLMESLGGLGHQEGKICPPVKLNDFAFHHNVSKPITYTEWT